MTLPTHAELSVRCYFNVDGLLVPYLDPGLVSSTWPDFTKGLVGSRLAVQSLAMLSALRGLGLDVREGS